MGLVGTRRPVVYPTMVMGFWVPLHHLAGLFESCVSVIWQLLKSHPRVSAHVLVARWSTSCVKISHGKVFIFLKNGGISGVGFAVGLLMEIAWLLCIISYSQAIPISDQCPKTQVAPTAAKTGWVNW